MNPRIDYSTTKNEDIATLAGLCRSVSLTPTLRVLVELRVSQINGCAYCLSSHADEARKAGIAQRQLDCLSAWRESALFGAREEAALGWTEAVAEVATTHVPDIVYSTAREAFSEAELIELTLIVVRMNALNRIAVSFRRVPVPVN